MPIESLCVACAESRSTNERTIRPCFKGVDVGGFAGELESGENLYGVMSELLHISQNGSEYRPVTEDTFARLAESKGVEVGDVELQKIDGGVMMQTVDCNSAKPILMALHIEEEDKKGLRFVWAKGGGVVAHTDMPIGEGGLPEAVACFMIQAAAHGLKYAGRDSTISNVVPVTHRALLSGKV